MGGYLLREGPSVRDRLIETRTLRRFKEPLRSLADHLGYTIVRKDFSTDFRSRLRARENIDLVLDIGANQGQYGSSLRRAGYDQDVLSFEPSSEAYAALCLRAKRDSRWSARHCAVGPAAGLATLRLSANSVSSSLLDMTPLHINAEHSSRPVAEEAVDVVTLDDAAAAICYGKRVWLKIDAQGYELPILRGGMEVLKLCSVLEAEASVRCLYDGQSDFLELLGLVREAGLSLVHLAPGLVDSSTGELLQFDFIAARRES